MPSLSVLSLRSLSRVVSLFVLCDEIVLLEDVIGRRWLLFKALLPRIRVLFVNIAGLPAVNIESPVEHWKERKKKERKLSEWMDEREEKRLQNYFRCPIKSLNSIKHLFIRRWHKLNLRCGAKEKCNQTNFLERWAYKLRLRRWR